MDRQQGCNRVLPGDGALQLNAERFIEEVRSDEPELANNLRIEERELDSGSMN
jgi:hypothetical protein